MSKRTKHENIPSMRDTARSFAEAIIAERKAFKRMYLVLRWATKKQERIRADE
jgi:hypothetical protein|nr:MAG TPA: hypothetical protein [Caudoviricetes sp.]